LAKSANTEKKETVNNNHKYRRIAESLRQRIKNGSLNTGDFLPTSKELAEAYSTTPVTIDRAIACLVEEGLVTRKPGVGTIVELPPGKKTSESVGSGLVAALVQSRTSSQYWERLLEGIDDILRPAGFSTLIGYHNQDYEVAMEHIRLFNDRGAGLVFFVPFDRQDQSSYEEDNYRIIDEMRAMGFTVIMLDRYVHGVGGHYVTEWSTKQGTEMMNSLIDRGYKNPICISTDYVSVIEERESSFVKGCKQGGIDDGESRIIRVPLKDLQNLNYEVIKKTIMTNENVDLIVSLNSRIFNSVIYTLTKLSAEKQDLNKVRLAGFVDFELMDLDRVEAYVEQPVREIGRAAGRMAKRILSNETGLEIEHSFVPCELRILDDKD